jgi:hypothetical protein
LPGETRLSGRNSDEGFSADGIDGVGKGYSSFVPSHRAAKISYIIDTYPAGARFSPGISRTQNLHPLICCAPHNN